MITLWMHIVICLCSTPYVVWLDEAFGAVCKYHCTCSRHLRIFSSTGDGIFSNTLPVRPTCVCDCSLFPQCGGRCRGKQFSRREDIWMAFWWKVGQWDRLVLQMISVVSSAFCIIGSELYTTLGTSLMVVNSLYATFQMSGWLAFYMWLLCLQYYPIW